MHGDSTPSCTSTDFEKLRNSVPGTYVRVAHVLVKGFIYLTFQQGKSKKVHDYLLSVQRNLACRRRGRHYH